MKSESVIKSIIIINTTFFVVSLLISGRGIGFSINPFTALSPSVNALIFLGASGTIPIDGYNEWWSLITANWLQWQFAPHRVQHDCTGTHSKAGHERLWCVSYVYYLYD